LGHQLTPTLRLPVLREQLAAAALRLAHGVDEQRVEYDEDGAWKEVDEDDAEPVVDVEVGGHVVRDERLVLLDAADQRDVRPVNQRRYGDRVKILVDEDSQLGQRRDDVDDDDGVDNVSDRTQLLGEHRMTHADVSDDTHNTTLNIIIELMHRHLLKMWLF